MKSLRGIAKNYDLLTPKERLGLVIAAGIRGDDAEQTRLVRAAKAMVIPTTDYVPFAQSFREVSMLAYVDLLEESVRYGEALFRLPPESEEEAQAEDEDEGEEDEPFDGQELDDDDLTAEDYSFFVALAHGYLLKAKADGWKLFCERLHVPPFVLMENLLGFPRVERAMQWAEDGAFTEKGFLRWLNRVRPESDPELTEVPVSAEQMADVTENAFRQQAERLGGIC